MANSYKCSDGTRVSKKTIDQRVRNAKKQKLQRQLDQFGYTFCEKCSISSGVRFDCSHINSVNDCQKDGMAELAWDLDNIQILCRDCHQKHDKLNLNFLSST